MMMTQTFHSSSTTTTTPTRTSRCVAMTARTNHRAMGGAAIVVVPRANAGGGGESNATDGFTNADAFAALSGLKKTSANDPFAAGGGRGRPAAPVGPSVGFVKAGVDVAGLPVTRDADAILKRFDETQRRESTESAVTACTKPALGQSTRALASRASRVMLGICAADAQEGLSSLKTWTAELGLPKGKLHGMDKDGVPVDPPKGAVFIKYNSMSGDAYISGYGGTFRGVLFTPELDDAAFRQYGYLPLDVLM
jgi:hypothetical protein